MSHVARGLQYARQVVAGEIPACRWVVLACRRHLADLERQRTEDFAFYFDESAGEDVCEFIESLCHVTGKWARRVPGDDTANQIRLEPWQSFCLTAQFGWLREDGLRRFRTVFVLEPRKNGKSTIEAAIGLYMLTCDREEGAQIYCGATSQDQARYVFKPAWLMVARDAEMRDALDLTLSGTPDNPRLISQHSTNSEFSALIGKPGDGGNPHLAIIDELHEHSDTTMLDAMRIGMGARRQPMLRMISTAGVDISGPCYQTQLEMQQILDGLVRADDVWAIIYGVDDDDPWDELETAIKANPNYGVSVQPEAIVSELEEARRNPTKAAAYKTKRLNMWVGSRSPFFNLEGWMALADPDLTEDDFAGEECWVATDAASKLDLCSTVKVFKRVVDGRMHYYMFGRHYLPEERVYSPDNPNKQYMAWHGEGQLVATDGNATDYDTVERDILRDTRQHVVRQWAFDPMYLTQMSQHLAAAGVEVIEIRQVAMQLSNPMKEWQSLIEDGRIHHNGDPVLAWAVGNCTARLDANDNVFPRKETPDRKIDPVLAGIMAIGRAMADEDVRPSADAFKVVFL